MKLLLIVLCAILLKESVYAHLLTALANGETVKFGPLVAKVKVEGQLPPKYPVLTKVDIKAARNLVCHLEHLRKFSANGTGVFPPLDPFLKSEIEPFNVDTGFLIAKIGLRNLVVSGLSKFHLHSLETRMNGSRVDFNISFPVLKVNVVYMFTMYNSVSSGSLSQSFIGRAHGQVVNLNLCGATRIETEPHLSDPVFQVRALDVNATANDVEGRATIQNLGFGDVNDVNWGPNHPHIREIKQRVADSVVKNVIYEINKFLLVFPASEVLQDYEKGNHTQ